VPLLFDFVRQYDLLLDCDDPRRMVVVVVVVVVVVSISICWQCI